MAKSAFEKTVVNTESRILQSMEEDLFTRAEEGVPHNTRELSGQLTETLLHSSREELIAQMERWLELAKATSLFSRGGGDLPLQWVPGRLADDPFRSLKNMMIGLVFYMNLYLLDTFPTEYETICAACDACVRTVERASNEDELLCSLTAGVLVLRETFMEPDHRPEYHPLAKRAKDFILQNLHEKIEIGALAERLGTTPSYLSQVFRKYEGMTVQEFILKERLARARNLLAYTDKPIEEICHSLAFTTSSYFGKRFKEQTGLTPVQYREKYNELYREEK